MPATEVAFFADGDSVPVLEWLETLYRTDKNAAANCIARIRLLAQFGHELRRPHADILRDGIYELRAKRGRVQYRILYFFHGRNATILAHALTKEGKVPTSDITRAIERKRQYEKSPTLHTAVQLVPQNPDELRRT